MMVTRVACAPQIVVAIRGRYQPTQRVSIGLRQRLVVQLGVEIWSVEGEIGASS